MREPRVYLSPYPPSREARPEAKVLHDEDDGAKAIRRLGILRRLSSSGRPGSRLRGPPRRVDAALWGDGAEGRGNVRPPALEVDIAPRAGPAHGGIDRPPAGVRFCRERRAAHSAAGMPLAREINLSRRQATKSQHGMADGRPIRRCA